MLLLLIVLLLLLLVVLLLLMVLLLYHPFSLTDTVVAICLILVPFALQHFDPETGMYRVVAGEMAVGIAADNLVSAMVGDLLEVAHFEVGAGVVEELSVVSVAGDVGWMVDGSDVVKESVREDTWWMVCVG